MNPSDENEYFDRKSLRVVTGRTADFASLAQDCVAFANGAGGRLLVGLEDGHALPPAEQRIDATLGETVRKRVGELTVNVTVVPERATAPNGGEYLIVNIVRSHGVASTSDGRYFLRVGDTCQPIVGDDVLRLANERPALPWEAMTALAVPRQRADVAKRAAFTAALRASDRVKASVKEKADDELLDHYGLAHGDVLTNLGVLLLGNAVDRARLGSAPIVQAVRYDERGTKIGKFVWDAHALSPVELVDAVWRELPDFRDSYEVPDGMFRRQVPAFDEAVIRELLVNALVHRPYTQRGDVFLNVHPDRLEVVNPGRLPLGVTPKNILHQSRRRNEGLARVFHDLKLMEREGSGFDLMYERLLTSGRTAPVIVEGVDSVHVTVPRRVVHPGVIRLLDEVDQRHQLSQRERIALGLIAQSEGLTASELCLQLELSDPASLKVWTDRLLSVGLIEQAGRTKGTRYFVPPDLLRGAGLDVRTTLSRVQPHRLRALILEDLERYPNSSSTEVHRRVAPELANKAVQRALQSLVGEGLVVGEGERRWRRYRAASLGQEDSRVR